ncbi:MAG: PKD domain-containing protein [Thermoplasmata archaeon]|nr:PKD domain-containing protein [Thermoplasmata archaeon]
MIAPGGYTWSNLSRIVAGGPSPRYGGAMVWDASDGYVLLFGGASAGAVVVLSDTWSYVNGSWANLSAQVTGAPPGLAAAQIAFDPSTHAVVMFGGEVRGGTIINLTWTYHALHWTNLTGRTGGTPHSRILAPMVTDSTDGEIVLYGGSYNGALQSESDTWTFKNGNWTNVTLTAGTNLGTLTLPIGSDDPADHGVIMAALYQPTPTTVVFGDYLYSGGSWSNITAVTTGTPDLLYTGAAGYLDALNGPIFLSAAVLNQTGGTVYTFEDELRTAGQWTNETAMTGGPPYIGLLPMVTVDRSDQTIVALGGDLVNGGAPSALWILSAPPLVSATANRTVVDQGGAVAFGGSVREGASPFTYRWNFGDGTVASAESGAHSYARAGLFTATLTVTDLVGHNVSSSVAVQVNPPLAVTAQAAPAPATAGQSVGLVAQTSGGTGPYTYAWNLGDGNTSSAAVATQTYAKAGNYSVSVKVTDALGASAVASFSLVVRSSSGSSGSSSSVSLSSGTGLYLLLGIVVLAIIVLALAVLLARRPKQPMAPPSPYSATGAPSPPPPSIVGGAPPGGAPPPWTEAHPPGRS